MAEWGNGPRRGPEYRPPGSSSRRFAHIYNSAMTCDQTISGPSRPRNNGRQFNDSQAHLTDNWRRPATETSPTATASSLATGESSAQSTLQGVIQSTSPMALQSSINITLHNGGVLLPSQDDSQDDSQDNSQDDSQSTPRASPRVNQQQTRLAVPRAGGQAAPRTGIYRPPRGDWEDNRRRVSQAGAQSTPRPSTMMEAVGIPQENPYSQLMGFFPQNENDTEDFPFLSVTDYNFYRSPLNTPWDNTRGNTWVNPQVNPQINTLANTLVNPQANLAVNVPDEIILPLEAPDLKMEPRDDFPDLPFENCIHPVLMPTVKVAYPGAQNRLYFCQLDKNRIRRETQHINNAVHDAARLAQVNAVLVHGYSRLVIQESGLGLEQTRDHKQAARLARRQAEEVTRRGYSEGTMREEWRNMVAQDLKVRRIGDVCRLQMDVSVFDTATLCFAARVRLAAEAMEFAHEAGLGHKLPIFAEANSNSNNRDDAEVCSEARHVLQVLQSLTGGHCRNDAISNFLRVRNQLRRLRDIIPMNSVKYIEAARLITHELEAMEQTKTYYNQFISWVEGVLRYIQSPSQSQTHNANDGQPGPSSDAMAVRGW